MNILLDFITLKWQTGAGEYARRVYRELLATIAKRQLVDVHVYALWDSKAGIAYEDMRQGAMSRVEYMDAADRAISEIVKDLQIDTFFIACAQYLGEYADLANVKCRTICVVHDLGYEEMFTNGMYYYFKLTNPKYRLGIAGEYGKPYWKNTLKIMKWFFDIRKERQMEIGLQLLQPSLEMARSNAKAQLVTVSEFTRNSLYYHYDVKPEQVQVLSSPERIYHGAASDIENAELRDIIVSGKRYYLMVSASRDTKNPEKAVKAFKRYAEADKEAYFVVVGYPTKTFDRMINVPYLSDCDLAAAFEHCYALVYPSFYEGFGYPPMEAMHYGKPVLASNTTSIPEVLEEAPIYFSPLYETEIFNALTKLTEENYASYEEKANKQYKKVHMRQERDLETLINMILGGE